MSDFSRIAEIIVGDKSTWQGKVFLTFDLDWCSDEVLGYTIDLVEEAEVSATWFVTHETSLLARLQENPKFELGIHPNFNFLLNADFRCGKAPDEVIERFLKVVPEAVSVRSHSMTQSSKILDDFVNAGLRYDCNHFIPSSAEMAIKPWLFWDERLVRVPYHWEDDVHCLYGWVGDVSRYVNDDAINVFDFHPIHVFLNTENLNRYEKSRANHKEVGALTEWVNRDAFGTCDFLKALMVLK